MKISILKTKNPYLNLAIEEYLLKNSEEEYFLLWQNDPTVVIGKNQNAYTEVNLDYVREHNIKISRRITGGGAVYHDEGNLNYSFISKKDEEGINFARFAAPVIEALSAMGLNAVLSGRNDILIDDKKISGNAQTVFGDRVLHHGTLLFDSRMDVLSAALHVDVEKLKSKAIKSVRSRVGNIKDFLKKDITAENFANEIKKYVIERYNAEEIEIECNDIIYNLMERNGSDEWLFPKSDYLSSFSINVKARYDFGGVEIRLGLKNDVITDACIFGDFFGTRDIAELSSFLVGINRADIPLKISTINISDYIHGMSSCEFLELINK